MKRLVLFAVIVLVLPGCADRAVTAVPTSYLDYSGLPDALSGVRS